MLRETVSVLSADTYLFVSMIEKRLRESLLCEKYKFLSMEEKLIAYQKSLMYSL